VPAPASCRDGKRVTPRARPRFSPSSSNTLALPSPRKRFTLAEANRTLPLVRMIVKDIVSVHAQVSHLQASLLAGTRPKRAEQLELELEQRLARLHELIEELNGVGCELKDCSVGLIDFLGRHEDRDIYLCWKLGEERIHYWHELHAGFAGRQPVSVLRD
jgi:hypothetical protein